MPKMNEVHVVGRRKAAVARVHLFSAGPGRIIVNKMPHTEYFSDRKDLISDLESPFKALGIDNDHLFKVNVRGGGKTGQAGAIRLGIARALARLDETSRKILRSEGYLTRDSRVVERKKPGRHKARKSEQYSKR